MAPLCPHAGRDRPRRHGPTGRRSTGGHGRRQDCERAATLRSRRLVPLHRDADDAHARVPGRRARPGDHARAVLVRAACATTSPSRVPLIPPFRRVLQHDAAAGAPPGVGRRHRLRHRPPRPPGRARHAGTPADLRALGRPRRRHRVGAARPLPAAVGALDRRGPRGRPRRRSSPRCTTRHGRHRRARDPLRRCSTSSRDRRARRRRRRTDAEPVAASARRRPTASCSRCRPASGCAPRAGIGRLVRRTAECGHRHRPAPLAETAPAGRHAAHRAAHAVQRRRSRRSARVAFARVPLAEVKAIKDRVRRPPSTTSCSPLCARTLRRYLAAPRRPARRAARSPSCPVSVRTEDETGAARQPGVGHVHPAPHRHRRPDRVPPRRQATAPRRPSPSTASSARRLLGDWAELADPRSLSCRHRPLSAGSSLADRTAGRCTTLVVSNMPGPPFPVYLGRRRARAGLPDGPGARGRRPEHHGDELPRHASTSASSPPPNLVPDLWDLADAVEPVAFDRARRRRRSDDDPSATPRSDGPSEIG